MKNVNVTELRQGDKVMLSGSLLEFLCADKIEPKRPEPYIKGIVVFKFKSIYNEDFIEDSKGCIKLGEQTEVKLIESEEEFNKIYHRIYSKMKHKQYGL